MPEKQLSPKQQQKREQIFQSATNLFSFKGFNDTTVSQIASEAGVSFGTVFNYFETKEVLFAAVIQEPLSEFKERLLDVQYELTRESMTDLVKTHIEFFARRRTYLQLIQQVLGQPRRYLDLMDDLDTFHEDVCQYIETIINQGKERGLLNVKDSSMTARGYFSFLIGIRLTFVEDDQADGVVFTNFTEVALRILGLSMESSDEME